MNDLFTPEQVAILTEQGRNHRSPDNRPIVPLKIFKQDVVDIVCLVTEIDPANPDLVYGLCDVGDCEPRFGRTDIALWQTLMETGVDITVEETLEAEHPWPVYMKAARQAGYITLHDPDIDRAAKGPTP